MLSYLEQEDEFLQSKRSSFKENIFLSNVEKTKYVAQSLLIADIYNNNC